MGNSFYKCDKLTTIELPVAKSIGAGAFQAMTNLVNISLPAAETFGNGAFYGCTKLATVTLPSATTFGINVFRKCPALTLVDLPKAHTFGDNVFSESKKNFTLKIKDPEQAVAFTSTTFPADIAKTVTLYLGPDLLPRPSGNTWNGLAWKQIKAY